MSCALILFYLSILSGPYVLVPPELFTISDRWNASESPSRVLNISYCFMFLTCGFPKKRTVRCLTYAAWMTSNEINILSAWLRKCDSLQPAGPAQLLRCFPSSDHASSYPTKAAITSDHSINSFDFPSLCSHISFRVRDCGIACQWCACCGRPWDIIGRVVRESDAKEIMYDQAKTRLLWLSIDGVSRFWSFMSEDAAPLMEEILAPLKLYSLDILW